MKSKFSIRDEVFNDERHIPTIKAALEYYNKYYKELGFIFDENSEDVYIVFDKEFNLSEGDRIFLGKVFRIITWKCVDIENDLIEYSLKEE